MAWNSPASVSQACFSFRHAALPHSVHLRDSKAVSLSDLSHLSEPTTSPCRVGPMMSAILSGDLLLSCAGDARGLLCQAHRSAVAATCSAFKHFQEAGALSFEGTAAVTSTLLECGYAAPEGVKKLSGCSFHLRVFFSFFLSLYFLGRERWHFTHLCVDLGQQKPGHKAQAPGCSSVSFCGDCRSPWYRRSCPDCCGEACSTNHPEVPLVSHSFCAPADSAHTHPYTPTHTIHTHTYIHTQTHPTQTHTDTS